MTRAQTLRSAAVLAALCALSACGDKGEGAAPVPLAASGPSEV